MAETTRLQGWTLAVLVSLVHPVCNPHANTTWPPTHGGRGCAQGHWQCSPFQCPEPRPPRMDAEASRGRAEGGCQPLEGWGPHHWGTWGAQELLPGQLINAKTRWIFHLFYCKVRPLGPAPRQGGRTHMATAGPAPRRHCAKGQAPSRTLLAPRAPQGSSDRGQLLWQARGPAPPQHQRQWTGPCHGLAQHPALPPGSTCPSAPSPPTAINKSGLALSPLPGAREALPRAEGPLRSAAPSTSAAGTAWPPRCRSLSPAPCRAAGNGGSRSHGSPGGHSSQGGG